LQNAKLSDARQRVHSSAFFAVSVIRSCGSGSTSGALVRDHAGAVKRIIISILGKVYQIFGLWGLSVIAPRLIRLLCGIMIAINLFAFAMNMITAVNA
jgi:hypothetical protein